VEWPAELVHVYERHYRQLVRAAYLLLGNRAEAEEVVQDAVVALFRRWTTVRDAEPYLRRSVVNHALGRLRHREVVARRAPDPPPPDAPSYLVELRDVLLGLPERQRAAIVLRHVADLHDDEIAEILGCRRATVRSLVARGLATLRLEVTP
jgi:RNA polymerase sigma factor (sigma-70 family)